MATSGSRPFRPRSSASPFMATRWSIVAAARQWPAGSAAQRAMGELARLYWYPLYAYLRRRGSRPAEAEDLVQGFFARLLEKDGLGTVDEAKGRFRSFLLAAVKYYQANEHHRHHAQKRGGTQTVVSLDAGDAESRYALEPVDDTPPERVYERRWALAVLEQVLLRLRAEYAARGQEALFAALEHGLVGSEAASHRAIAAQRGMTEGAVKVAAHRLRRRYRDLLRDEIAQTVAGPALVDEEIRFLRASL